MARFDLGTVVFAKADTNQEIPLTIIGITTDISDGREVFYLVTAKIHPKTGSSERGYAFGGFIGIEDKKQVLKYCLGGVLKGVDYNTRGRFYWLRVDAAVAGGPLTRDAISNHLVRMYGGK